MFWGISGGDLLQSGASFSAALIGIWGIFVQVKKQNEAQKDALEEQLKVQKESLEKQLKRERKNSFDSSVALENYKNYIAFANVCTKISFDSKINIERCDKLNINDFNEFIKETNDIYQCYLNCYNEYKDYSIIFITINQYADNKNKTNKNADIVSKFDSIISLRDVTTKIFGQLVSLIENDKEKEAVLFFEKNKDILKESFKQEYQIYLSTSSYISKLANELII